MKLKKLLIKIIVSSIAISFIFIFTNYPFINKTTDSTTSLYNNSKLKKLPTNPTQVKILNGCGEKGVANLYTDFLRENDFDVIDYKNAQNFNYSNTKIIVHKNDVIINELINILKIEPINIDYTYDKNIFYDLTLIIGKDYKQLESYNKVINNYNPFE